MDDAIGIPEEQLRAAAKIMLYVKSTLILTDVLQ